mgnify:CR=1 FL=1
MTATMTIQNADNNLLNALKSVIRLYPQARVSIKKSNEEFFSDCDLQEMKNQAKLYEAGKATLITKTFEELGIEA